MIKGYYIHNQKKDGSGVCKKIESHIAVFRKHFDISELVLEAKKENWVQRKIRMKVFKARAKLNYTETLNKMEGPNFVYIRKQILDQSFLTFLRGIKTSYPDCKIIMEVPTYPYWNEYPQNKIGKQIIEEEKQVIPFLKKYVDAVISVGHESHLFGMETIQVNNGINLEYTEVSPKSKKTDEINLIAVARFRPEHGYERILNSMIDYYSQSGDENVKLHIVGEGAECEYYRSLARNEILDGKVRFYGFLSGKELDDVYAQADIGLGFFGLYKAGATYVSSLKSGEYFAKGLPIISAVEEDCMKNEGSKYSLILPNDDSKIMMEKILDFYDQMYPDEDILSVHQQIRHYAEESLSFDLAMSPIIEYIKNGIKKKDTEIIKKKTSQE